jgi:ribosome-binding factor A
MKEVSIRHNRIEERLLEELETIIPLELNDPRLINTTVTRALLSADMKSCRVYVIDRSEPEARAEILRALNHAASHVRSEIAGSLGLKFTPKFQFFYDDTTERAMRVEQLIENLHHPAGAEDPSAQGADETHG